MNHREDDGMDDEPAEPSDDKHLKPEARAMERVAELRMHSELAAIFEGPRKFEAQIKPGLDPEIARDVQRSMAKFERAKIESTPILDASVMPEALRILMLPATSTKLSTNDYHLYRRPGEVMMIRWLAGDEVETFYERYQAHCDAALNAAREDERQNAWRGDDQTVGYLAALDKAELPAATLYYREPLRKHGICVITTVTTDAVNIRFLCEQLMGAGVDEVVGEASAPADGAGEQELSWFFKLFSLRGNKDGTERMCFFAFLQKSEDEFEF